MLRHNGFAPYNLCKFFLTVNSNIVLVLSLLAAEEEAWFCVEEAEANFVQPLLLVSPHQLLLHQPRDAVN